MIENENCIFNPPHDADEEDFVTQFKPITFNVQTFKSGDNGEEIKIGIPQEMSTEKSENENNVSEIQIIKIKANHSQEQKSLNDEENSEDKEIEVITFTNKNNHNEQTKSTEQNGSASKRKFSHVKSSQDQLVTETTGKIAKKIDNVFKLRDKISEKKQKENNSSSSSSSKSDEDQKPKPQFRYNLPRTRYSQQKLSSFGLSKLHQRQSQQLKNINISTSSSQPSLQVPSKKRHSIPYPLLQQAPLQKVVLEPVSRDLLIQCLLVVQRGFLGIGNKYYLKQKQTGNILCTAKKQLFSIGTKYLIGLGVGGCSRRDHGFGGIFEGDFGGGNWNLMSPIVPAKFNEGRVCEHYRRIMALKYDAGVIAANGCKQMEVIVLDPEGRLERKLGNGKQKLIKLVTPQPTLRKGQCIFDFKGLAKMPSSKNFILQSKQKNACLIFAKQRENVYQMNIQYPLSLLQGFSLCLASLDSKFLV